jgi:hypothetical protein
VSRREDIVSTTIRPRMFAVGLLASLLLALPSPAHAANHQLTGTAVFNSSPGTPCPVPPSAYDSYPALVMTGSLDGCWYTHIETARVTSGGVYLESGTELFVGRLDGGPEGTFTTTYKFEAKLDADAAEVRGRCQHSIVSGSGTGGFAGATRRVDFKDIIGDPITYVYRGHISFVDPAVTLPLRLWAPAAPRRSSFSPRAGPSAAPAGPSS